MSEEQPPMVSVLQTTDGGLMAMARSVLEAAQIPFVVQGEAGLNLFPLGSAGSKVNLRSVGADLRVPEEFADEARALLQTPAEPLPDDGP